MLTVNQTDLHARGRNASRILVCSTIIVCSFGLIFNILVYMNMISINEKITQMKNSELNKYTSLLADSLTMGKISLGVMLMYVGFLTDVILFGNMYIKWPYFTLTFIGCVIVLLTTIH